MYTRLVLKTEPSPPPLMLLDFFLRCVQVEAAKYDLNYIGLSGNIGCMGKCRKERRSATHGGEEEGTGGGRES